MSNKFKQILIMLIIITVGYTQIGCGSSNKNNESNSNKVNSNEVNSDVQSNAESEIHFINTGNSDAVLIIKDKKAALIDGGDNDDEKLIVNYIKNQGIKELEYVFATHPHADHIGGLDAVVDEIKINNLYVGNGDSESKTYQDFIKSASKKGLNPSVPLLNSEFKLGESTFKVISVAKTKEPNNNSIVLLYTNGKDKVLLMGDAEKEIEGEINPGKVDLLKVGHHGSHSSTTKEFIKKINPEYAVIFASKNNKYGHPHAESMKVLENNKIEVHRSDECGDIVFVSNGKGLKTNCKIGSYKPGAKSKSSNESVIKQNTAVLSSENVIKDNIVENEKKENSSEIVYWSASGSKYHSIPDCSGMKKAISGSVAESKKTPCAKCF